MIMQACIVKHKIAQICARQTFPSIFGALEIKLAEGPIDRTTSLLRQSLQRVVSQLKNCNDYSASFESIMYRVDWLHGCIFRYSIIHHGILWTEITQLVCDEKYHLTIMLRGRGDKAFRVEKLSSGRRGRPCIVSENKLA